MGSRRRSRKHIGPKVTDQVSHSHAQKFACRHPDPTDINIPSNDQGYSGEYRGRVRCLLRPLTVVLLGRLTIDKLSNDVLLGIFDSYRREYEGVDSTRWWHVLVHICERWRHIIFAFPGHLNLQLVCKSKTDMKTSLDIWPALPISIQAVYPNYADEDDIIGTLGNRDRIAGIDFVGLTCSQFEKCVALMQQSFPVLSSLHLFTDGQLGYVSSDAFLGGSAPRLKSVLLSGIRFPALPKLLSSARDLVDLFLGYLSIDDVSLEAMVTCLSVLNRLQHLVICFKKEMSSPGPTIQSPTSLTPTVLPVLTYFSLRGPHEYLENFVARIDAPLLDNGALAFDDEPTFDTARVPQFIHRTEIFKLLGGVDVYFRKKGASGKGCVTLYLRPSTGPATFELSFPCSGLLSQVAQLGRSWAQCQALLSHVERLRLGGDSLVEWNSWQVPWQGFFKPFTAV